MIPNLRLFTALLSTAALLSCATNPASIVDKSKLTTKEQDQVSQLLSESSVEIIDESNPELDVWKLNLNEFPKSGNEKDHQLALKNRILINIYKCTEEDLFAPDTRAMNILASLNLSVILPFNRNINCENKLEIIDNSTGNKKEYILINQLKRRYGFVMIFDFLTTEQINLEYKKKIVRNLLKQSIRGTDE